MKKIAFGLLVAAMSLQTSAAFAFGFGGCCGGESCCGNNFDGFYLGGNLGVISHTAFRQDFDGFFGSLPAGWTSNNTGFIGGVQLGYDKECNGTVFGLVWDFNGTTADRKWDVAGTNHVHNKHSWFSTLRGRAGLTVCDALLYITGGLAVAKAEGRWTRPTDDFHFSKTRYGWTGGVGTEFAACDNWTFGFDLLFAQFDNKHRTFTSGGTTPITYTFGHAEQVWTGRFLVNYRFDDLCCCW